MENLKKQNPNASWSNLLTGVAVLVMVAVFSYAYFSKPESVSSDENGNTVELARGDELTPTSASEDNEDTSSFEEGDMTFESSDYTTVEKGEGLWQVAQRVCNDGEKYNLIAAANGLSVWEGLIEGMELKVVCN